MQPYERYILRNLDMKSHVKENIIQNKIKACYIQIHEQHPERRNPVKCQNGKETSSFDTSSHGEDEEDLPTVSLLPLMYSGSHLISI